MASSGLVVKIFRVSWCRFDHRRGVDIFVFLEAAQRFKFARLGDDHAFHGAYGLVIPVHRGFKGAAQFFKMVHESLEAIVQFRPCFGDCLGIFRHIHLTRHHDDDLEEAEQQHGRCNQHFLIGCEIKQAAVGFGDGRVKVVAGEKKDCEFGTAGHAGIIAAGQSFNVFAYLRGQFCGNLMMARIVIEVVDEIYDGGLGIDGDAQFVMDVDQEVGT